MPLPIIILITLLALINLAVSIQTGRSPRYELQQKRLQYLLIWLLPVIGAVITWSINRHSARPPEYKTAFPDTVDNTSIETAHTREHFISIED